MPTTSPLDPVPPDPSSRPEEPAVAPAAERSGTPEPARLLVPVDGSAASTRHLVWALLEAAHRESFVLAVAVVDADTDPGERTATQILLDAQLRHAIGQTEVRGRARTALLDPTSYEALTGADAGADLVGVGPRRTTGLLPAMHRTPVRRPLARRL